MKHIRNVYGDYFDIAVAGFPQQQLLPPDELAQEIQWLKEKIDAGANFIFTQMFYDVDVFLDWVKTVRAAGITVPIVPGIAPIQTWNGFQKATALAKTKIPQSFLDALEPHKNNDEKVREIGVKLVAELCRRILQEDIGIKGLHFYTMNLEKATKMLLQELNLVPRVETLKPLPWRQVSKFRYVLLSRILTVFSTCRVSLPTEDPKQFDLSSGQIVPNHIWLVLRTGMSIQTDGSVIRAALRSVNWMVMVFGSNKRSVSDLIPFHESFLTNFIERRGS